MWRVLSIGTIVLVALLGVGMWLLREHASRPPPPEASTSGLRRAFESLDEVVPARVAVLSENRASWVERWRLVTGARDRISFSTFILADDPVGWAFLGALQERARSGVRIRVLVDGVGTEADGAFAGALEHLAATGVRVKIVRPLADRILDAIAHLDPTDVMGSEHDKILVVDGESSLVGGRNVAVEYVAGGGDLPTAFVDLDVLLHGPGVARKLTRAFSQQWNSEASAALKPRPDPALAQRLEAAREAMAMWLDGRSMSRESRGSFDRLGSIRGALAERGELETFEAEAIVLDSRIRHVSDVDPVSDGLRRLVDATDAFVWAESPYLVLADEVVDVLSDASERGVRFEVLTNSPVSSDNLLSQAAFVVQWPEILAAVPTMRLFVGGTPRTLHAKMAVLDERLSLVGTYNLDPLSMATNSEVVIGLWSPALAETLAQRGRQLVASGPPVAYEYRLRRIGEHGQVEVVFGPEDHCPSSLLAKLAVPRAVVGVADTAGDVVEAAAEGVGGILAPDR